VLFHVLNASATKIRRLALPGHLFRIVELDRQNTERASASTGRRSQPSNLPGAGLAAARHQLTVSHAEIAEARASVAQVKADLETARRNLGYTEVRSPIDGYVGKSGAGWGLRRERYIPLKRHHGARASGLCQFQGGSAVGHAAGAAGDNPAVGFSPSSPIRPSILRFSPSK
jgi:hypothetical protein